MASKRKSNKSSLGTTELEGIPAHQPGCSSGGTFAASSSVCSLPRYLYFDTLPPEPRLSELKAQNFEPISILSLPRTDERDHRNFLFALAQGMSEGTIVADKDRLHAAELDMKAHGMLSKYGPKDMAESKRRQSVGDLISEWKLGRHSLGQSSVVDPREIERVLYEQAGIHSLLSPEKKGTIKHKWKRKSKGRSE